MSNKKINEILDEQMKELRESLKQRITEGYFIHCKPKEIPDFKTYDESFNWHRKQNYIAEKVVGSWVDNTMVEFHSYTRKLIESLAEEMQSVFKGDVEHTGDCGGNDYCECHVEKQRLKVKEMLSSLK